MEDYELVRGIMDDVKMGLNPYGRELTKKRNVRLMDAIWTLLSRERRKSLAVSDAAGAFISWAHSS
jgi:hypothetical protein